MPTFTVLDAPSILGLKPTGVETLPDALKRAGLIERLGAKHVGRVDAPLFSADRDASTSLLNPQSIKDFSVALSEKVIDVLEDNEFPIVLGGDCSILIGCMLALRHQGQYGLFFIDGHVDFYQPEAEPNGEVASMELALITGRGPNILANIDGLKPLVRDENVVAFGYRDVDEQKEHGSQDIRLSSIHSFDLEQIRTVGHTIIAQQAIDILQEKPLDGFWIHLDADVLGDDIMPAVDYRLPGGLQWSEIAELLRMLRASENAVGMTITIFNPSLDPDGSIAEKFVETIVLGLS